MNISEAMDKAYEMGKQHQLELIVQTLFLADQKFDAKLLELLMRAAPIHPALVGKMLSEWGKNQDA